MSMPLDPTAAPKRSTDPPPTDAYVQDGDDLLPLFPTRNAKPAAAAPGSSHIRLDEPASGTDLRLAATPIQVGRYPIRGEIARGGMGVILRGYDPVLGRELAVKVLHDHYQHQPSSLQRFLEEARIGGQLQHPGIVPVHEIGRSIDGRSFFTMKLVEGHTLAEALRIRQDPSENLQRFLHIFDDVCQTMAYAHSRGVIHRDLKPSNIMVGAFGEVHVTDWGLAKNIRFGHPSSVDFLPASGDEPPGALPTDTPPTRAGQVIGTPAYMSPEQARGEIDQLDERADVFSLGAILCEILTGQPPFAGSPASALKLARHGDLEPAYSRLNESGAGGELLALARACLAVEPLDRPRNAGIVARRLREYLTGVANRLRAAELTAARAEAKAVEEAKRRRMAVVAAVTIASGILIAVGVVWRQLEKQGEAEQVVAADMRLAAGLREQGRLSEALSAIRKGEQLLPVGNSELRRELHLRHAELDMLIKLENIRLSQADVTGMRFNIAESTRLYAEAFRAFGLDALALSPDDFGERLRRDSIHRALLAGILDWAFITRDVEEKQRLMQAVRVADPQLSVLLDRWREAVAKRDRGAIHDLVATAEIPALPPVGWINLASIIFRVGAEEDGIQLLRSVQRQHENDFWVNHELAQQLHLAKAPQLDDAIGFYRIAVTLQPRSPGVYSNLGVALKRRGKLDEAAAIFRHAINLKADYAVAYNNLGNVLALQRKFAEAEDAVRTALSLEASYPDAHRSLAQLLREQNRLPEAEVEFRQALRLRPEDAALANDLGNVLWRQDKLDEALELFDRALSIDDGHFLAVFNRGMLLADLGRLDDAIASYRRARKLEPKNGMVALYLGEALRRKGDPNEAIPLLQESLTLHADAFLAHRALGAIFAGQGRNSEAADAFRNAAVSNPDDALVQVLLGEALLKCHETAAAEEAFRKAVELQADNAHAHCGLALALRENGKYAEALVAMKRGHELGVKQPNWAFPSAEWLQEAEQLAELESRLPSILQHELTPESAEARLRYAVMSSNKRMPRDAARLYAGAFTSNPGLADDYQAQHRYNAARAAAAAARCETVPSDNLSDAERSGLRRQALDWLSAELTAWTKHLEQNPKLKHTDLARLLRRWQQEPDLASLREPAAQANLPTEERKAWQKLWVDVENLRKRAQG